MNIELTGTPDEMVDQWLDAVIGFRGEDGPSLLPQGYAYSCAEDFVKQHGERFPVEAMVCVEGAPRACYGNSIVRAASDGWTYVEGYALTPFEMLVMHAWCVKPDGTPVECTWPSPGLAYRGVRFSVERADDATWNGDASVLDDWQRRWPLYRERWTGEDYSIEWPASDRLDVARSMRDLLYPSTSD
jgi:hypothetical protein